MVLQIHEHLQAGDKKADLAREFGVSKTTISRIAKCTGSTLELALEALGTPRQIALEADVKYNYQHLPEGVDLIVYATRLDALVRAGFSRRQAESAITAIENLRDDEPAPPTPRVEATS